MQVLKAQPLQKCDDLQTARAMMTNYDRGMRPVELFYLVRDGLHGYQVTALDARQLEFPRLANIQQVRSCIWSAFHQGLQFLDAELAH